MSTLVFPSTLPGTRLNVQREPYTDVRIDESVSGKEIRSSWWFSPRYRYTLTIEMLRASSAYLEFQKLFGFFARHLGQLDSFLFTDPEDNSVTAHAFGVGNASTTAFQLQRTLVADADLAAAASRNYWPAYSDGYEPVYEFNGAPAVYVGGVLKVAGTDYTLSSGSAGGLVTFALPPPASAPTATPSTTGGTLAAATYFYKVSALNASGESIGSAEASSTTTGTTGSVALSWAAVTGATSYRVYRGTTAGGESAYYAPGNVTSYTDTGAASTAGTPLTTPTATQPPASGAVLTWSGSYYRRVRFDGPGLVGERIVQSYWAVKTVKLISVKP